MLKNKKLTGFKLQLRLLSELAPGEREAVPGLVRLQHCGPVDGSENRHQHPQQGTYKETQPTGLEQKNHKKTCRLREMTNMWSAVLWSEETETFGQTHRKVFHQKCTVRSFTVGSNCAFLPFKCEKSENKLGFGLEICVV